MSREKKISALCCADAVSLLVSRPFRRLLFGGFFLFVAGLSLLSRKGVDENFSAEVQSNAFLAHLGMYAILTSLAWFACGEGASARLVRFTLPKLRKEGILRLCFAFSGMFFGNLLELLQGTAWIGRSCTLSDTLANSLGAFLAALCAPSLSEKLNPRP